MTVMARIVPIGRRNLFSERRRGLLGVAGTAAALLLVLTVGAIFDGAMRQITRYIDTQPATVFVAQRGVRNLHMASSSVPASAIEAVVVVRGVTAVDPILFTQDGLETPDGRRLAYVIGFNPGRAGGPSDLAAGTQPGRGDIVLDEGTAASLGVGAGERVDALGTSWRVSGLADDLSNIANGTAFLRFDDFAAVRASEATASYLLVSTNEDPDTVAAAIERATGLSATSREAFAVSERDLVADMIGNVLQIITAAAWLVGFAVVALTLYAATRSRLRDIGVMKALGAAKPLLWRVVLTQAAWTIGLALAVAAVLTPSVGVVVGATSSPLAVVVEPEAVARAAVISTVVAVTASVAPLIRVSRLDPASVFRR
jgi:putative ABC transport system permease protein